MPVGVNLYVKPSISITPQALRQSVGYVSSGVSINSYQIKVGSSVGKELDYTYLYSPNLLYSPHILYPFGKTPGIYPTKVEVVHE